MPRAPIRREPTKPSRSAAPARPPRDGRALAYRALRAVLEDDRNLDLALASELPPREKAFAHMLAATTLKRLGEIDAALTPLLTQPFAKLAPDARALLRIGAVQMFMGTPPHAVVAATVDLAKAEAPHFSGLTNAVLRRLVREGLPQRDPRESARLNTPDWLWDSWLAAYGEDVAAKIAAAHLEEPPLDISAREPERWAEALGAELLPTGTLRRGARAGGEIRALPGYVDGAWWVQDAAAAMPARLLTGLAGKRVLDLCAAPGGKAAQLAAMGYDVVAVEQSPPRAQLLRDNLARLKLPAEIVVADATTYATTPVDGILLDVPCTATGTIRRHPDIPWRKSAVDLGRLVPVQTRLLDHAATLLAPGGVLVYAVCSLESAEGPQRIAEFLARHDGFRRKPITPTDVGGDAGLITADGDLRTLPCHWAERGGMDGFYAARLLRR
ncbi:MAG TPA: transcription antitermination factor NusB [Alphaproteobacteria bacterium]|nr:transcription antitermination factor NusB [Alphaproteobacteria bacterium]